MSESKINLTSVLFKQYLRSNSSESTLYITSSGSMVRFQDFRSKVELLAGVLEKRVASGEAVMLMLNDTPDLAALFLAVIAIGAIPISLNPKLALADTRWIFEDCDAKLAVCEESRFDELSGFLGENVFAINGLDKWLAEANKDWNYYKLKDKSEFCLLQYTSGSTGKPKGVKHSTAGILSCCKLFAKDHLKISPGEIIYSVPKVFFGYGMGNSLFFPLYCGACALLDYRWPTPQLVKANLKQFKPNIFFGVPAIYKGLIESDDDQDIFGHSRVLFSAGSPVTPHMFNKVYSKWGKWLVDGIGATEVGHVFLSNDIDNPLPVTGKPLPGYEVRLVNGNLEDVSDRERGELLVKGGSVADGYLNNEEESHAKFLQNGFYRTGDIFKKNEDGYYQYLGRVDDHFKSKGQWVIPITIENKLLDHFDEIAECSLVPGYMDGEISPVLYLVPQITVKDAGKLNDEVSQFLKEHAESHTRPAIINTIAQLPKNENGKLKRKSLITEIKMA